jgi:hypothetical protein
MRRRLIRPVIGVGTSLVIASLAILAGMRFAPAQASSVENAVVLAPVAVDGHAIPGDNDPATLDVSGGTGVDQVGTPGSHAPSELPASVTAEIAALDSAGGVDPAGAHLLVGGAGTGADSGTGAAGGAAGDPCAPSTGAVPTDCPGGLRSAIFADTAPPELDVWPVADVATEPAGTSIYCPGLTPGDGELGLGVGTSVPAAVTVQYWPVADPTDVHTVVPAADPAQVADWNARVAATGTYPVHEFVFQHCGLLTGLRPHTDYRLSAVAVDDEFSRVSDPVERTFSSDGQPTIPPMQAIPLGNSLLYVSAPNYGTANPPIINAWAVSAGQPADCSGFNSTRAGLQAARPATLLAVSAEYLHAHNYADGYNHAMVAVYEVPEGSTVVVCARWYNNDAPSWDRDTPTRQEFLVAMSPDTAAPRITLTSVSLVHSVDPMSVSVAASTPFGNLCGRVVVPAEATSAGLLDVNQLLCDVAAPESWTAQLGSGQNMVISTDVTWAGSVIHSSYVLPLSRYACLGTCDLPPTLTYSVALPTVRVGAGMCGSGFGGDCTPPTRDTALGTAQIQVDWAQGNVDGLDHWVVGSSDDTPPAAPPVPDAPRFDTSQYVDVTLSSDGWSGSARLSVRADRHVTYTTRIAGDCWVGAPPAAATGDTYPATVGVYGATASFSGLCPGATYMVTVELVDDAGHRTVANASRDAGTTWWPGAIVSVPVRSYAVTATLQVSTDPSFYQAWDLVGGQVSYAPDFYSDSRVDFGTARCLSRDQTSITGTNDGTAVQARTVHVRVLARTQAEALYFGVNHDADCSWPGPNNFVADDEFDVAWTDLLRGVTVTGDLPQTDVRPVPGMPAPMHYRLTLRLGPVR